jgi:peptidoglycan-N-acetylmuramic acid deacetylase
MGKQKLFWKNSILFVIATAVILLTGCGKQPPEQNAQVAAETEEASQDTAGLSDDRLPGGVYKEETDEEAVSTPDPAETEEEPVQPEAPKTARLDTEALDKLDNTKYGWGLSLNKKHETPGIPSSVKSLIEKHDGIYVGDTSNKVIYLTFDEGYENGYTPKILDALKDNDVKAIFFITGPYLKKNTDLVKRMLDEGHQVGNHTINHPSLPAVDYATMERELLGLEEQFYSVFGTGFKYMRPPMGEYSERTLEAARQLGYKTVFWSFAYRDWDVNDQKGADYAYDKVMENLHNGAVILLHAVSKDNAEALDRIIKDVKAQGYEFKPFDL